jgi:putative hydrolase of the HAD superfamily
MKNIIFDLGGVVLEGKASSVLDKLNLNEDEYNELIKFFDDWYKLDIDEETIENKYNSYNFSNNNYKDKLLKYYELRNINMNLINLIKELNKNNKVYVLSDNNKDASIYYEKVLNELVNIDGYVFSYEYKTIKREEKLFDIFLNKYNLDPSTCYFIDNTKENIEIANSKGINGILYTSDEELINELKERGVINE